MARVTASDIKIDDTFVKALVVGDPGTGKSCFAATFPGKLAVFDFDKGGITYKKAGADAELFQYEISQRGWIEFNKEFNEVCKEVREGKFRTVVVDSTSMLSDMAMEQALLLDPKRSATNGPLWNVHYGMVKNLVEGKLRQLLQLPANILIIAHLEIITDKESGAILGTQPLLPGSLSAKLPGYFDEVYYAFAKTAGAVTNFVLQTAPKGHYKARSRFSGKQKDMPLEIANDYASLKAAIDKAAAADNAK